MNRSIPEYPQTGLPVNTLDLLRLLVPKEKPRLLVVGDLILDRYVFSRLERLSPEAPAPILRHVKSRYWAGGAGAVASMAAYLGAEVKLGGLISADANSLRLTLLLQRAGVDSSLLKWLPKRPPPLKTRFIACLPGGRPQQLLRWDTEKVQPLSEEEARLVWERLQPLLLERWPQAVLVADYGKGVCHPRLVQQLVEWGLGAAMPVLIDPHPAAAWTAYTGADCLLPNRQEAASFVGRSIADSPAALAAAQKLIDRLHLRSVLVKLDRQGVVWAEHTGRQSHVPPSAFGHLPSVLDPCGAGDMVLAALGYGLAVGADWPQAIALAQLAAGQKLRHWGCQPVSRPDLLARLLAHGRNQSLESKLVGLDDLEVILRAYRLAGRRIVFTNGCFDLLHPGHLATLEFARRQGDVLIVAVNSDRSVRELKGPGRPIIPEAERVRMLAALACVDWVVVFDTASVLPVIDRIRPDVLVKGGKEPPERIVGADFVRSYGGQVLQGPAVEGFSTSALAAQTFCPLAQTPLAASPPLSDPAPEH